LRRRIEPEDEENEEDEENQEESTQHHQEAEEDEEEEHDVEDPIVRQVRLMSGNCRDGGSVITISQRSMSRLEASVDKGTERLQSALRNYTGIPREPREELIEGTVYTFLLQSGATKWMKMVKLPPKVIVDISRTSNKYWLANRGRGPSPSVTTIDHLLLLILLYRTAMNMDQIALTFGFKSTNTLQSAINRMRPIFQQTMKERWWTNRQRPIPLDGDDPYIALNFDHSTFSVFRPKGRFEEAKMYWDGKNECYGLKKEFACMASPPHYCLFSMKAFVGSEHDYECHKKTFQEYIPYLRKTPQEKASLSSDRSFPTWAALGDRGYTGPGGDTPGLRRITIKKNAKTRAERERNKILSECRVTVEMFFGRLVKCWNLGMKIYPFDHKNFDVDIDNMACLTNEHIRSLSPLAELDRKIYQAHLEKRLEDQLERKQKKDLSNQNYRARIRDMHHEIENEED